MKKTIAMGDQCFSTRYSKCFNLQFLVIVMYNQGLLFMGCIHILIERFQMLKFESQVVKCLGSLHNMMKCLITIYYYYCHFENAKILRFLSQRAPKEP